MSLKKIEQVKADKGFRIWDLIVYGTIIVLVIVLFIVIFTTRDTSSLTGVRITVKAQVVCEYEFGKEEPQIPPDKKDIVSFEKKGNEIIVTIQNEKDKNVVLIDTNKKTAKMLEANCKGKQCIYFATMDDNSDFIYCSPHGLKIEPLYKDLDNDLIPV